MIFKGAVPLKQDNNDISVLKFLLNQLTTKVTVISLHGFGHHVKDISAVHREIGGLAPSLFRGISALRNIVTSAGA